MADFSSYKVTRTGASKSTIADWSLNYNNLLDALGGSGLGIIDTTVSITTDTVYSGPILFGANGKLSISSGKTVTFDAPPSVLAPPNQQIFSGLGAVTFTRGGVVYPNWWQTNTTPGTTHMSTAIQAAMDSLTYGTVQLLPQAYGIDAGIVRTTNPINLKAFGPLQTKLVVLANSITVLKFQNIGDFSEQNMAGGPEIDGISIDATGYTDVDGIWFNGVLWGKVSRYSAYSTRVPLSLSTDVNADRTNNCNTFDDLLFLNTIYGITGSGYDSSTGVTNNTFNHFKILMQGGAGAGINMDTWADTNSFMNGLIAMGYNDSYGILLNSSDSTNKHDVYNNHFYNVFIGIDGSPTGCVCAAIGRSDDYAPALGHEFVGCHFSDSSTGTPQVNANTLVSFVDCYMGGAKGNPGYIDRGDPSAVDFDKGDLTIDGGSYTLSLSSIVPFGARAVLLNVRVNSDTVGHGIVLWKNGSTYQYNGGPVYAEVINADKYQDVHVALDWPNRNIAYSAVSAVGDYANLDLTVKGWWY
jgi:hypothetical protein